MVKVKRKIIRIDNELCNGCGNCIPACPEQALQIVDTPNGPKARLVKEFFCDGLGACMGTCPTEALKIVEEEVDPYNEEATVARIKEKAPDMLQTHLEHIAEHNRKEHVRHKHHGTQCPSAKVIQWKTEEKEKGKTARMDTELRQWPVQLHLVPATAPYFENADLVIVADCVREFPPGFPERQRGRSGLSKAG